MKTLRITTYWSTEEADCIYQLLDELKIAVWQQYGKDITLMYEEIRDEQQKDNGPSEMNEEFPF